MSSRVYWLFISIWVSIAKATSLDTQTLFSQTSASLLISFHYWAKPKINIGQKGPDVCD